MTDPRSYVELAGHPAVVTALTVAVFVAAQKAQRRWPYIPLFNPTLAGVVAVIGYVECSGISYQRYILNTQVLSFMLAPTVVLLAVPLYRRLPLIRASWRIIAASLAVGVPTGSLSAIVLAAAFGANASIVHSIAAKSVTTGIAVGISEAIGGIPVLTAAFVIVSGIFGAAFGPALIRATGVRDERAIGLAMGIAGHGIGTARAFQLSDRTGTFSSLGMALNGIATAIVVPAAFHLVHTWSDQGTGSAPTVPPSGHKSGLLAHSMGVALALACMATLTYCVLRFRSGRRRAGSTRGERDIAYAGEDLR